MFLTFSFWYVHNNLPTYSDQVEGIFYISAKHLQYIFYLQNGNFMYKEIMQNYVHRTLKSFKVY